MTDFGYQDDYVGLMKGVLSSRCKDLNILDLTHNIPLGNIESAAFTLLKDYLYFPEDSIFVNVVDPGVGTKRDILIADIGNRTFISPDNGLLGPLLKNANCKSVRVFTGFSKNIGEISSTFHGRDIMSPLAASLVCGLESDIKYLRTSEWNNSVNVEPELFGNECVGKIMIIDSFGNLITNIEKELVSNGRLIFNGEDIPNIETFDEGCNDKLSYLIGSKDTVEIVVKNSSAEKKSGAKYGDKVKWILS